MKVYGFYTASNGATKVVLADHINNVVLRLDKQEFDQHFAGRAFPGDGIESANPNFKVAIKNASKSRGAELFGEVSGVKVKDLRLVSAPKEPVGPTSKQKRLVHCTNCDAEIMRRKDRPDAKHFCDVQCRTEYGRKITTKKQCSHCKKDFLRMDSRMPKSGNVFCSKRCCYLYRKKQKQDKVGWIPCTCLGCKKEFKLQLAQYNRRIKTRGSTGCCSRACVNKMLQEKGRLNTVNCNCRVCGKDFVIPKSKYDYRVKKNGAEPLCSPDCGRRLGHTITALRRAQGVNINERLTTVVLFECSNCKKPLKTTLKDYNEKKKVSRGCGPYCSRKCSFELAEKLKSDFIQKLSYSNDALKVEYFKRKNEATKNSALTTYVKTSCAHCSKQMTLTKKGYNDKVRYNANGVAFCDRSCKDDFTLKVRNEFAKNRQDKIKKTMELVTW